MLKWSTLGCLVLMLLADRPALAAEVDYLRDVKPILAAHCFSCHGAVRQKSGLRLDAAGLIRKGGKNGLAVVPGKSGESLLIDAVTGNDRPRMPPEQEGEALSASQIDILKKWIDQGAKAPDEPIPDDPRNHWAFRAVVRPSGPDVRECDWARNPIDAFVAAERERRGLTPNEPASQAMLLRRVYLDLIGLPPTREELAAFLADPGQDTYERVVDRLLSSPHYGERWGRHWMDVWRYSDPFGLGDEIRYSQRHIWRWRDWIIESLNADKGYDRMIVEMLAGDEVAPADPRVLRATGFLARNWYRYNRNAWLQETVDHTAMGFLGLTLKCARCHDHKYDPLAQLDYYRFRAFFEPHDIRTDAMPGQPDTVKDGVPRAFDGNTKAPTYLFVRGDDRYPDKGRALTPGVPAVLGGATIEVREVKPSAEDKRRALELAAEDALLLARAAVRAAETLAKPPAPLAAKKLAAARAQLAAVEARIAAERATYAAGDPRREALARTAARAEREASALTAEEELLAAEQVLAEARKKQGPEDAKKKAIMAAEQKLSQARKARDDAQAALQKKDTAYQALAKLNPAQSSGRRLALARWITGKDNPLTARVAVNHIWLRHFGKPLVASVANFGLAGKQPTHPALLDWLAVEFMDSGWSMKHLHRLIVTSSTYRLGSGPGSGTSFAADPENRYLWRMNSRRMEGEVVRDSLLALAAQLDAKQGGPILDENQGQISHRRSVYFRLSTEHKMMFLDLFDLASPNECYERRESVLPQQALALANSAMALTAARILAKRLAAGPHADFIRTAFEQVLTRPPTQDEHQRCVRFLREQTALFQKGTPLSPFPAGPAVAVPPAAEAAQRARENLVHVLLNHNDFVTIR